MKTVKPRECDTVIENDRSQFYMNSFLKYGHNWSRLKNFGCY